MSGNIAVRRPATGSRFAALHRLAESALIALCKLNAIQFDAPWNPRRGHC